MQQPALKKRIRFNFSFQFSWSLIATKAHHKTRHNHKKLSILLESYCNLVVKEEYWFEKALSILLESYCNVAVLAGSAEEVHTFNSPGVLLQLLARCDVFWRNPETFNSPGVLLQRERDATGRAGGTPVFQFSWSLIATGRAGSGRR